MRKAFSAEAKVSPSESYRIKMSLFVLIILVVGFMARANQYVSATALDPEKNLISSHLFQPAVSYLPPDKSWNTWVGANFTVQNGEVQIPRIPDGKLNRAQLCFSWSTILADRLKISFNYSLQGNGGVDFCGKSFRLEPGNSQTFSVEVPVKIMDDNGYITFSCGGNNGKLVVKNLVVNSIKPDSGTGKPLIVDGVEVNAIYYAKTDFKHTFLDRRAADMMQKNLYLAGAGVLPVKVLSKDRKPANGIIIGQAAKEYIDAKRISQVGEGGYALKVDKGIAVVYGKDSYANPGGVFALLKKLGFFYLTETEYISPSGENLHLNRLEENVTPAIAWRVDGWYRESTTVGMSDPVCLSDFRILGTYRWFSHSFPFIIGWNEFKDSDLDFFAMQEDGARKKSQRGDLHYCFSNKKLQQLAVKRISELLDADPVGKLFFFGPGDGMHLYCRCVKCKSLGTPTDSRLYFINQIAEELRKTHPEVILTACAYTDSAPAPLKYKPAPNVVIVYCPYEPYWMNHLQTDHRDNSDGWKQLKEWIKICPDNMGAEVYPSSCPERLNVWPAFYANYEKYKYFGRHKFKVLAFCGLRPWSKTVPGSGIFNPAQRYVMIRVMWNPELNFEEEIDNFFKLYYGKAAPALRKIFDLLHAEVKKRDWSQNTEKVIRGFMTQELADKCLRLHDQAEQAVGNEQPYNDRVARERLYILWSYLTDVNRNNGKLKPKDFPTYAKYLREFCQLGEKFDVLNLGRVSFEKWFWDTASIKIPLKGYWYNAPVIKKLVADPEATLGKDIPHVQRKTDYGYSIPARGILGGRDINSGWLRSKAAPARQLHRPSSGFGMARMLLTLEQTPEKPIIIKVNGVDNEKKDPAMMRLLVNGEQVYEGKVPWGKDAWSFRNFEVPVKYWKKGDNEIQVLNITPDKEAFTQGRQGSLNYYWGWFIIDECQFHVK